MRNKDKYIFRLVNNKKSKCLLKALDKYLKYYPVKLYVYDNKYYLIYFDEFNEKNPEINVNGITKAFRIAILYEKLKTDKVLKELIIPCNLYCNNQSELVFEVKNLDFLVAYLRII